jgi:hypothetical protein
MHVERVRRDAGAPRHSLRRPRTALVNQPGGDLPETRAVTPPRGDEGAPNARANEHRVPSYYLVPWLLVAMCVALLALIYWGGFIEERRNGRPRA